MLLFQNVVPINRGNPVATLRCSGLCQVDNSVNAVFTAALSIFSPQFNATVGVSSNPAWPHTVASVASETEAAIALTVTPFSICYCTISIALWRSLPAIQLVNRGGHAVSATPDSISFAMMEFGGSFDARYSVSLLDPSSSFAWPKYVVAIMWEIRTPPSNGRDLE